MNSDRRIEVLARDVRPQTFSRKSCRPRARAVSATDHLGLRFAFLERQRVRARLQYGQCTSTIFSYLRRYVQSYKTIPLVAPSTDLGDGIMRSERPIGKCDAPAPVFHHGWHGTTILGLPFFVRAIDDSFRPVLAPPSATRRHAGSGEEQDSRPLTLCQVISNYGDLGRLCQRCDETC